MDTPAESITTPPAAPETVLILRVCRKDGSSSHGFKWPTEESSKRSDWDPRAECGRGLHGWLWGDGDASVAGGLESDPDGTWLVVEVRKADVVDLGGKVKFPRGTAIFAGGATEAAGMVLARTATRW